MYHSSQQRNTVRKFSSVQRSHIRRTAAAAERAGRYTTPSVYAELGAFYGVPVHVILDVIQSRRGGRL